MLVRYWMTSTPVCVSERSPLSEVLSLMRDHRIRRLPVLRGALLCGIVTDSDLYRFAEPRWVRGMAPVPPQGMETLAGQTAGEIMTPDPFVCGPDTPLEEAGDFMRKQKIGCLPVLDQEALTGIVTESDILEALAKLTRAEGDGKRVCFLIPMTEKNQIFYRMVETCELLELEILTLVTQVLPSERAHLVTMRVRGEKEEEFVQSLWKMKYKVILAGENASPVRRAGEPARPAGSGKDLP